MELYQTYANCFEDAQSVYPNPADKFITVDYKISDPGQTGILRINDFKGIVIKEIPLKGIHNKVVIGTINLNEGLYFCNLVVDSSVSQSVKLIINH